MSHGAVRGQTEIYKLTLLEFTAGILLSFAVEEMITQAHQATAEYGKQGAWETIALVGGFSLFALLSAYLA